MAIRSHTQRTLLLGFIVSICLCGMVGVYCLMFGRMGRLEERVLMTTAAIGACSILGMAAAVPWERRIWHPIGPIAVMAIFIALIISIIEIWSASWMYPQSRYWEEALAASWVCAVALPHISLLSLARLNSKWKIVQIITVCMIVALGGTLIVSILAESFTDDRARAIGIFAIIAVCGTIAVPILHRVSAIKINEPVHTTDLILTITCPRCATTQQLPTGRTKCVSCGLRFRIEIDEDNCAKCGYPLYQLQSSVCPECGTPIAAQSAPIVT